MLAILSIASVGTLVLQTVICPKQNKPISVACVGDSITSSFGYPEILQQLIGANYIVSNFGSGGTTINLDSESPYMLDPIFQEVKNKQPEIIIIMLGTNDARFDNQHFNCTFLNDYKIIINEFRSLSSNPKIWIVKPPPIFNNSLGLNQEFYKNYIITKIEAAAMQTNLPIIDVYSSLVNNMYYFYDGVHPTDEGSMSIANIIYERLIHELIKK